MEFLEDNQNLEINIKSSEDNVQSNETNNIPVEIPPLIPNLENKKDINIITILI